MSEIFAVPAERSRDSLCDKSKYQTMYRRSVEDADGFWAEQSRRLDWYKQPTRIKNTSFDGDVSIKWFEDGELNVAHNCLDRHLATRGDQVAIIWEADDPKIDKKITYRELHDRVCRLANVLKDQGVRKGDRVTIYLPMIPEAAYAMLACARIGAVHSVVFGGFSPDSLADRVNDAQAKVVVTCDGGVRGGRAVPLKENVDKALEKCAPDVKVLMFRHTGMDVAMREGRDLDAGRLMREASADCAPERMNAEDPLFTLYTSGSTASPRACSTPRAATCSTPR
jgi:acetyl-CoA synthetase